LHLQELRDAIAAFRAKGKFAIAFSKLREFGPAPGYYSPPRSTRSGCSAGSLGLVGLRSESRSFAARSIGSASSPLRHREDTRAR